jgi:hypothetical protein
MAGRDREKNARTIAVRTPDPFDERRVSRLVVKVEEHSAPDCSAETTNSSIGAGISAGYLTILVKT